MNPWVPRASRPRRPPSSARPVLRVGLRVLVTCATSPPIHVALADAAGNAVASLVDGDEVEILAWRRGRSVDPHYRVRSNGGAEGWIEAANLAQKPSPLAPPHAEPSDASPGRGPGR